MDKIDCGLNANDLIMEYMCFLVENGYEPSFSSAEFVTFLYGISELYEVDGLTFDNYELFNRFINYKNVTGWVNPRSTEYDTDPHMFIEWSGKDQDYILHANYKLNCIDKMQLSLAYLANSHYRNKIKENIREWTADRSKRTIDYNAALTTTDFIVGRDLAAIIVYRLWEKYIEQHIKSGQWPVQCTDINKYLFENDLADIIDVPSIKATLIEVYKQLSRKIAAMHHDDPTLKISSSNESYLASANYNMLIEGYEELFNTYFDSKENVLDLDASKIFARKNSVKILTKLKDKPMLVKLVKNLSDATE